MQTMMRGHKVALDVLRTILRDKKITTKWEDFFAKKVHEGVTIPIPYMSDFLIDPKSRIAIECVVMFETQRRKQLTQCAMLVIDAIIDDLKKQLIPPQEFKHPWYGRQEIQEMREFNEDMIQSFLMGDRYEDFMFIFREPRAV